MSTFSLRSLFVARANQCGESHNVTAHRSCAVSCRLLCPLQFMEDRVYRQPFNDQESLCFAAGSGGREPVNPLFTDREERAGESPVNFP